MSETSKMVLGLAELAAVVKIIDTCSKRGAFEGSELAAVGALRNKIDSFVKAHSTPEKSTNNNEQHPIQSGGPQGDPSGVRPDLRGTGSNQDLQGSNQGSPQVA